MELILISAMTRDRVIGREGGLPWDIPEEYEHFLSLVRGHPILMGRTSHEIFGADLTGCRRIVISRSLSSLPDAEVVPGVDAALELARSIGGRVFCGGGATIYRQTLPHADALYLSILKQRYEGDTRFPEFDEHAWRLTRTDDHPRFEFRVYEKEGHSSFPGKGDTAEPKKPTAAPNRVG